MTTDYPVTEKVMVIERQITTLKRLWDDRLKRKEPFALHHLSVMKAIAKDYRSSLETRNGTSTEG